MNLLKTLASISGMTMLSRITGLLRESLFAHAVGASAYSDAFIVAFRIPNLLRRLFAEGAFAQAFVPILSEYKNKYGPDDTKSLIDHVANMLVWATLLTSLVGIAGTPLFVSLIADGLNKNPDAFQAAVVMTRIMFPYICCMSFVAMAGGILNTWGEYKIPAFTPVLLNLSFIVAAWLVAPYVRQPVYVMAGAVMVGGLLQVGIQIPALIKIGMLPKLTLRPLTSLAQPGVRQVLKKMGPAIFGVSVAQISLMINTSIASHLAIGSISALSYADRLMEFPTALLGVALGTILLPSLSKASVNGDTVEYSSLLDWGLRLNFLLALPAAVGLAVMAEPLISTLFHYGKFDAHAVQMAKQPLIAYSVGLIGIILVKTLAPAFYARQDIRTPVKIAIGVLCATQLMNLVFVPWLKVAGLALSIGIAACLNAALLYIGLRRGKIYQPCKGWGGFYFKLMGALCLMAGTTSIATGAINWIELGQHNAMLRAAALMAVVVVGALTYFSALWIMGFRLNDFKRSTK